MAYQYSLSKIIMWWKKVLKGVLKLTTVLILLVRDAVIHSQMNQCYTVNRLISFMACQPSLGYLMLKSFFFFLQAMLVSSNYFS